MKLQLVAGLAIFTLTTSQVFAFALEEDFTEDLILSVQEDDTTYRYDSTMANAKESLTELDFFPEETPSEKKFAGDPTCPSGEQLLSEDACLDASDTYIAGH